MSTFFPNSNDQREAAPMIYSRELLPGSYSEAPPVISDNMMIYMNYLSSSGSDTLAVNSHQNSCNDIPPVGDSVSNHFGGSRIGENDFSEWGNGRSEMSFMAPMGGATGLLQSMQNLQGQGLSLSLSTQIPSAMQMTSVEYRNPNPGFSSFMNPNLTISSEASGNSDTMKTSISPYEMPSISRIVFNSKYLKAAQHLLDEVVSVWKAVKPKESKKDQIKSSNEGDGGLKDGNSNPQESISNCPKELPAAERQSLQDKLTKLLSLLDEVDKRYKQYYHQMQIVVSSFDVIAGCGAAKPYTALALQTISRHFRCLRDAITGQIQVLRKNLGQQDTSENNGVGISRLRFVDQHLRQQRVLQQLGMIQQHAWRPQRGLPESSVSILRAWLFEHFLHPYPKDSDKSMLAKQTGLTRSQVSNWFINARVRLWKPMVEEMYKEETGDAEMDSNCSSEAEHKATKGDTNTTASEDRNEDFKQNATSAGTERHGAGQYLDSKHHHIPNIEMVGTETEYGVLRSKEEQRLCLDDSNLYPDTIVQSDGGSGRFMISELGNFGNGNGVSLTLGLQHCEGSGFPMSVDTHHGFVTMRGDEVYNTASSSVGPQTAADFDCMDSGNRTQRFSSSHMFHDFVA